MSLKYPDIIDARLTRMFFFKHTPDLGDTVEHISFFDFFKVWMSFTTTTTTTTTTITTTTTSDSNVF